MTAAVAAIRRLVRGHARRFVVLLFCLGALGAGQLAAVAVAGGSQSAAGTATTGQHGQDCPPGYNDTGGGCEHNGGGGNCGDNQSGNDNGLGNNGNDSGFGHRGDCEATTPTPSTSTTTTTTSTSTTSTRTSATTPTTPTTPSTPTTSTTPTATGPFAPPSVRCATRLAANRLRFIVGRRSTLVVRVRGADGQPVAGVRVLVRGAGVTLQAKTGSAGVARFTVRPRSAGVIRISLAQAAACDPLSRLARAVGVFKPPKPNFTGR